MQNRRAKTFNGNLEQALAQSPENLYIGSNVKGTGKLVLEIKDKSGKATPVILRKTWVPIDLMQFVDREAIRTSQSLKSFIRIGVLRLLDVADAKDIMETDAAKKEAVRIGVLNPSCLETVAVDVRVDGEENGSGTSGDSAHLKNLLDELLVQTDDEALQGKFLDAINEYYAEPEAISKEEILVSLKQVAAYCSEKNFTSSQKEIETAINELNGVAEKPMR